MATFEQKVMVERARAVALIENLSRNVGRGFDKLLKMQSTVKKRTRGTFVGAPLMGPRAKTDWQAVISKMRPRFNVAQAAAEAKKSTRDASTMLGRLVTRGQIKRRREKGTFSKVR